MFTLGSVFVGMAISQAHKDRHNTSANNKDTTLFNVSSFFLCKELIPGYLDGITGEYTPPQGYFVNEEEADEFDKSMGFKKRTVADWKRMFGLFEYKNGWGIRSYLGNESEVIIPQKIGKNEVVAIGSSSFSNRIGSFGKGEKNIKDVVLPNGLKEIMGEAFYKCSNLEFIY